MTDITDQDRRVAHEWAASIDPDMKCWSDRERAAARVILATVEAPDPTLAEELRELGALLEEEGGAGAESTVWARDLADRAEQIDRRDKYTRKIEQERDEALVERDEAREALAVECRRAEQIEKERDEALGATIETADWRHWFRDNQKLHAEVQRVREIIRKHKEKTARAVGERDEALAEVERLTDLLEPTIWEQGKHPQWGNAPYSTKVIDHPFGGLMVRNPYMEWGTPQQAREEAYALLAAADYVEENQ